MQDTTNLFPFFAVGLTEWAKQRFSYPYPDLFRGTLHTLAWLMTELHQQNAQKMAYPASMTQLRHLFTLPVDAWWPLDSDLLPDSIDPRLPLLHEPYSDDSSLDEQLLVYLEDLEIPAGISSQHIQTILDQRWIQKVLFWARDDPDQRDDEYRLIRHFIIKHPWATEQQLQDGLKALLHFDRSSIGEIYERHQHFDYLVRHDDLYWTCPNCRGLLTWVQGQARCAKQVCGRLYPDYYNKNSMEPRTDIRRLKWSMHARVCVPGQVEVSLYEALKALQGIDVKLWPGVDRYDIGIVFKLLKKRWAVDVKDYESPTKLALVLKKKPFLSFSHDPFLRWDRAFYVIPTYRTGFIPGYLETMRDILRGEPSFQRVTITDSDQFYKMVIKELGM